MSEALTRLSIEELSSLYHHQQTAIRMRLEEFSRVEPSEYFYELIYCLLTPQSNARNAEKAVAMLRQHCFHEASINPEQLLHQPEFYIRFHKTKAKHLIAMKNQYPLIEQYLSNGHSAIQTREWLVNTVKGLGWKEASHFLRNIGHRNLAILDRHILKNLIRFRVIKMTPKSLTSKIYQSIEMKFQSFAQRVGIPIDELDLLFWSMETGEILK